MRRLLVALSAALVFTAACGDDGGVSSTGAGDGTETTAAVTSAPGGVTTAAAPGAATTTATVAPASVATTATTATTVGPTTTVKPAATTKAGPTTTAAAITFAEFSVTVSPKCPTTTPDPNVSYTAVTTPPAVVVKWKLAGVIPDNVYTAVDDQNGVYDNGLPTTGTATFGKDCNAQHTYYVVAELGGQKFVKSKKA